MNWDRGAGVLPTTHRHMSAEDYFALPEGPPYFQLIDGELFMSPSPHFFHQEIAGNIFAALHQDLRHHPLGKVVIAPSDVQLDEGNVFQPDVFFIRNEQLKCVDEHGLKGAPPLVVEVISGATGRLDQGPKKTLYAAHGVEEMWLVLPEKRQIEVWRFAADRLSPAATFHLGQSLSTPLLPGLELALSEVFAS